MQEDQIPLNGEHGRPEEYLGEKAWRHEEINASFKQAVWKEKALTDFVTYPKRNQKGQSSCTCYVAAKQLSVDEKQENGKWRELSPRSIYPYVASPSGGSSSLDVMKFATKFGMTLEHLLVSDDLTEEQMRLVGDYVPDAKIVATIYRPSAFVECSSDFDTIASIIQGYRDVGQNKVVGVSVIGTNNGTWLSPFPKPPANPSDKNLWYHRVTVTDFGLIEGKKFLAIDNTFGMEAGISGQQFLGEDYEPLLYGAMYTLNRKDDSNNGEVIKPTYRWDHDLMTGSTGKDVLMLQQALQSMGMFPVSNIVKPTGSFGGITKQAVILFQQAFMITPTGYVGPVTREKLNQIFGQ